MPLAVSVASAIVHSATGTVAQPVGNWANGNLLVALCYARAAPSTGIWTAPGGWTSGASGHSHNLAGAAACFSLPLTSTAATGYTFSFSSGTVGLAILEYNGNSYTQVDDSAFSDNGGSGTTLTFPSATASVANDAVILAWGVNVTGATVTWPTGFTEEYNFTSGSPTFPTTIAGADDTLAASGSTGTFIATGSTATSQQTLLTVLLKANASSTTNLTCYDTIGFDSLSVINSNEGISNESLSNVTCLSTVLEEILDTINAVDRAFADSLSKTSFSLNMPIEFLQRLVGIYTVGVDLLSIINSTNLVFSDTKSLLSSNILTIGNEFLLTANYYDKLYTDRIYSYSITDKFFVDSLSNITINGLGSIDSVRNMQQVSDTLESDILLDINNINLALVDYIGTVKTTIISNDTVSIDLLQNITKYDNGGAESLILESFSEKNGVENLGQKISSESIISEILDNITSTDTTYSDSKGSINPINDVASDSVINENSSDKIGVESLTEKISSESIYSDVLNTMRLVQPVYSDTTSINNYYETVGMEYLRSIVPVSVYQIPLESLIQSNKTDTVQSEWSGSQIITVSFSVPMEHLASIKRIEIPSQETILQIFRGETINNEVLTDRYGSILFDSENLSAQKLTIPINLESNLTQKFADSINNESLLNYTLSNSIISDSKGSIVIAEQLGLESTFGLIFQSVAFIDAVSPQLISVLNEALPIEYLNKIITPGLGGIDFSGFNTLRFSSDFIDAPLVKDFLQTWQKSMKRFITYKANTPKPLRPLPQVTQFPPKNISDYLDYTIYFPPLSGSYNPIVSGGIVSIDPAGIICSIEEIEGGCYLTFWLSGGQNNINYAITFKVVRLSGAEYTGTYWLPVQALTPPS